MLPEVAAEVLQFLSRCDLDKAFAINKWLNALIANCCDAGPLRSVQSVDLLSSGNSFILSVVYEPYNRFYRSIGSIDEAVLDIVSLIRHSCIESLELDADYLRITTTLSSDYWTKLVDAFRYGAVRNLSLRGVDFDALDYDTFLAAPGFRSLQSLAVRDSVVHIGFVTDDLIRSSITNGLLSLSFRGNESVIPRGVSEEAILDFFFRADATPEGRSLSLMLEGTGVTAMFIAEFFERLRSTPSRPSGRLEFYGAAEQRGLLAYAGYRAPDGEHRRLATYRFPSSHDVEESYYEVQLFENPFNRFMRVLFGLKRSSL